jgi:hypothetical protein
MMLFFYQGARGSGGVRLLYSPEEVEHAAKEMIGDFLITKQTGAEGRSGHRERTVREGGQVNASAVHDESEGRGTSVADSGCLSRIPDPDFYRSRIHKHLQKRGGKNYRVVVIPFFVATNFTKFNIILLLNC